MKYSGIDKILTFILVSSIIASSAILIYILVTPKPGERFTEFYILDPDGKASNYPTNIKFGEEGKVIIGIINQEYENITYRLEVIFNGYLIYEDQVFLIENKKWESPFTFQATKKKEIQKLEFLLYRDQQKEAYRKLHIWVTVT